MVVMAPLIPLAHRVVPSRGVNRDINSPIFAAAHLFSDVEHGGFVHLPFTDYDGTVNVHTPEHVAHGRGGSIVCSDFVSLADPAPGFQRCGFGHPGEFQGKMAVHTVFSCLLCYDNFIALCEILLSWHK
jgi:hypothetical protein